MTPPARTLQGQNRKIIWGQIGFGGGGHTRADFPDGGYELRNANYKGCTSKAITTVIEDPSSKNFLVFEGFMDFLSYKQMNVQKPCNAIIANSVTNTYSLLKELESRQAEKIFVYGDNDPAGELMLKNIENKFKDKVIDMSASYKRANCKDLNEHLVGMTPKARGMKL